MFLLCCLCFHKIDADGRTHRSVDEGVALMRPYGFDETWCPVAVVVENRRQGLAALDLDFAVCPAWDFDDGVDDGGVVFVGVERDVVPE